MTMTDVVGQRRLAFEGCFNFRDIGGYETESGRTVRWRRLFRSDGLGRLTPTDLTAMRALNLASVLDLRTADEISTSGRVAAEAVGSYHHVPILDVIPTPEEIETRWISPEAVAERYFQMLLDGEDSLVEALAVLTDPTAYPALVHCAAGKDRTGIMVAAILGVIGVNDEDIAADYALSGDGMRDMYAWLRDTYPDNHADLERRAPAILTADAATMLQFCAHVRDGFGSFDGWLATVGMRTARGHIRRALLG
jgi:protein-tyrosine phosphatase